MKALSLVVISAATVLLSIVAQAFDHSLELSVVFPDGVSRTTTVDYDDVVDLVGDKHAYMLDSWAYAGLIKLGLEYETEAVREPVGTAIVRIASSANGPAGSWRYFANGYLGPYQLDNHAATGINEITLRFVESPAP